MPMARPNNSFSVEEAAAGIRNDQLHAREAAIDQMSQKRKSCGTSLVPLQYSELFEVLNGFTSQGQKRSRTALSPQEAALFDDCHSS